MPDPMPDLMPEPLTHLITSIVSRPFSAVIVLLFTCNIFWHYHHGRPGSAIYWLVSALIIIAVEWLIPAWG